MHQHLLGTNLQEIPLLGIPMLQQFGGLAAAGFGQMAADQPFELIHPMGHGHRAGHQRFHVHQRRCFTIRVIEIRHPAGHARAKVCANLAQDHGHAAGHVFTAVRPTALNDNLGSRVAHGEAFTRPPRSKEIAIGRAVQNGVADNGVLRRDNGRGHGRTHHNGAPRQALTHIVIGIARHFQLQPRSRKGAKGLASRACQFDRQVIGLQVVAHLELADDMAGCPRTDGAVRVLHRIAQLHLFPIFEEPRRVAHNLRVQRVGHRVAVLIAVVNNLGRAIDGDQHRVQVQIIKVGRATADLRQQVRTANHLIQGLRTDRGEDFPHFLRIEGDQVHNFVCRSGVLRTQVFVLSTHANRAGVGLTLTHHDTAHRDQRSGPNTILFRTHHRGHYDVASRAQTTIGPQRDAFTQVVHRQNLMRLGQTHLPWQTTVFD
mmetsp:Transcript_7112/g.11612  ORF Transcript_7112/g.11612 Transcript_7112/m.11612 type:complete len:430 (+) Transcript_7112:1278-2567(+)